MEVMLTINWHVDMDSCITQKYKTIYPCPTACTFYAASTDEMPRYTLQPGVRKVFDFEIPMPVLPDVAEGEPLDLTIKVSNGRISYTRRYPDNKT